MKMMKNIYEALIPSKRIPFWIFWLLLGWAVLVPSGQIIGIYFGNNHLPLTRIIAGFAAPFLPLVYNWLHHGYKKVMQGLSSILWQDDLDFVEWLSYQEESIFTFKKLPAKLFTGIVLLATITTTAISNLEFNSISHRVFFILWIIPILFLCSHGTYILYALLSNLHAVARRPAKVPFFMLPHPAISELQNYFSKGAIAITVLYILLVIAFYEAFQTNLIGLVWLSILGLYPLSMFIWSLLQVHVLMKMIKRNQYEAISEEVDKALSKSISSKNLDSINRLEKLMGIQMKVKSMSEWPINTEGILTFSFTLLTATAQIIIAVMSIKSP